MSTLQGVQVIELVLTHDHRNSYSLHADNHAGQYDTTPVGLGTQEPSSPNTSHLRPVDGGPAAWRLLIAAFIFEALFWGFPSSFGVFQNYYTKLPRFRTQSPSMNGGNTGVNTTSKIALIGTLAQGIYYMGAPASAYLTRRFPRQRNVQIYTGWVMCITGLLAASFTTSLDGLILTQGVVYGVGFTVLTYPIIGMVDEWWVARKGMAFGLISAASGAAGVAMPFVLQSLLDRYGYEITLRACAVAMAVLTTPLLPLLKGRLPVSASAAVMMGKVNWSFTKRPLFWVYSLATFVQGLGFFFPPVFLPSYATVVGLKATDGALLLALMSVAQVLGQFVFGWLSDKKGSVISLSILCCVVASAATFILWGLFRSLGVLILFSILYGFFGFGFGTMRVAMGRMVSEDPSAAVTTYAIFVFVQGIGLVLVGPLSAGLLASGEELQRYAEGGYSYLILFVGSCLTASAILMCAGYPLTSRLTSQ